MQIRHPPRAGMRALEPKAPQLGVNWSNQPQRWMRWRASMSLELPETKAEKVKTGLMKANVFHGPGNFGIVLKPIPGLRVSEHFGATCTCLLPKTRPAQFAPKLAGAVRVWPLK